MNIWEAQDYIKWLPQGNGTYEVRYSYEGESASTFCKSYNDACDKYSEYMKIILKASKS